MDIRALDREAMEVRFIEANMVAFKRYVARCRIYRPIRSFLS